MSGLKRRVGPDGHKERAQDGIALMGDPGFAKKYPMLLEFLARVEWEPGQIRQKGTLFFFVEHGCFKACVSDKDADLIAFVTSVTFEGVLDACEKGLAKDTLDWRPSTQGRAKRAK